ncbi:MAG TPA: carboxypeptidase-like regulatory domain-containing protein, partial [Myxococcaceae bacterium]|nr:carboxypeptidase-like regulatory domain-containing protein [Myxococcaceae bacterium]
MSFELSDALALAPGLPAARASVRDFRKEPTLVMGGPLGPVSGRVLENGSPVQGAEVSLDSTGCPSHSVTTDAEGRFSLPSAVRPPYLNTVLARSGARAARGNASAGGQVDLELLPTGAVELALADVVDGAPVGDAGVTVSWRSGPAADEQVQVFSGTTDSAGKVRFEQVPPGQGEVFVTGWVREGQAPVQLADAGTSQATLRVERGETLKGKVVDMRGRPVLGAVVELSSPKTQGIRNVAATDDAGRWRIGNLPRDSYRVAVSVPGGPTASALATPPGEVELALEAEAPAPAARPAHPRRVRVSGTVVDAAGKGVAGARLFAVSQDSPLAMMLRMNVRGWFRPAALASLGNPQISERAGKFTLETASNSLVIAVGDGAYSPLTPVSPEGGPLALALSQPLPKDPLDGELGLVANRDVSPTVVVSGTAGHREVQWPRGGFMTQRSIVAGVPIRWSCPGAQGTAVSLEATVQGAPGGPHREDLTSRRLRGGESSPQLYLWQIDQVRRACAKDGQMDIPSPPIELSLRCSTGASLAATVHIPLHVNCGAATALSPADTTAERMRFAHRQSCVTPSEVDADVPTAVTFCKVLPRTVAPMPDSLRLVRLDARWRVQSAQSPCFDASTGPADEAPECGPTLTLTEKRDGIIRFAFQATFRDGTRELSEPIALMVRTPEGDARRAEELKTAQQRWAVEHREDRWESYTNAKYGYRLEYPPDWEQLTLSADSRTGETYDAVSKLSGT